MQQRRGILAVYEYLDDLTSAMESMHGDTKFQGHEVFSPTSYHDIEHAGRFGNSPVRFFTLVGAMTGTFTGFGLALFCDWDWPMVVGGKMAGIYSIIAYVIMGFELTILLGGIATIMGMLVMGKIPNPKADVVDTRTTDDRFAIFVPDVDLESEQASKLKSWGAEEIRMVEAAV